MLAKLEELSEDELKQVTGGVVFIDSDDYDPKETYEYSYK